MLHFLYFYFIIFLSLVTAKPNESKSIKPTVEEFQNALSSLQTYENEPWVKINIDKNDIADVKEIFEKDNDQLSKKAPHSIPIFLALVYLGYLKEANLLYEEGLLDGPKRHIYIKYARDIARKEQHLKLLEWLEPLAHEYESAVWGFSQNTDLLIEAAKRMDKATLFNLIARLSKFGGSNKMRSRNLIEVIRHTVTKTTFSQQWLAQIFWNCLKPSHFFEEHNSGLEVAVMLLQEGYIKPETIRTFLNLELLINLEGTEVAMSKWIRASNVLESAGIKMEKEIFDALVYSLKAKELINERFYKQVLQFKPPLEDNTPLKIAEELKDKELIKDLRQYGYHSKFEILNRLKKMSLSHN